MKFEKYEKPDLEELEFLLEGSFLSETSTDVEEGGAFGGDENEIA